jgi:hypothetical protein
MDYWNDQMQYSSVSLWDNFEKCGRILCNSWLWCVYVLDWSGVNSFTLIIYAYFGIIININQYARYEQIKSGNNVSKPYVFIITTYDMIWYIYIYIYSTSVGLKPGGSSTSQIYTQTVREVRAMPPPLSYFFCVCNIFYRSWPLYLWVIKWIITSAHCTIFI